MLTLKWKWNAHGRGFGWVGQPVGHPLEKNFLRFPKDAPKPPLLGKFSPAVALTFREERFIHFNSHSRASNLDRIHSSNGIGAYFSQEIAPIDNGVWPPTQFVAALFHTRNFVTPSIGKQHEYLT